MKKYKKRKRKKITKIATTFLDSIQVQHIPRSLVDGADSTIGKWNEWRARILYYISMARAGVFCLERGKKEP